MPILEPRSFFNGAGGREKPWTSHNGGRRYADSREGDGSGVPLCRRCGVGERHARHMVSALVERGVLASESPRAPLRLVFPAAPASRWMPGLFPEKHV
ncbi:MAG TPA: hypothetical protein VKO18_08785 [Terriglobia bacterium]|nr:hypothetical protein [Terriglobia bacterium]